MKVLNPSMKFIAVLLSSLLLLIIAGCNDGMKPPYQLGNDSINALQFGFIAQDENWLYYTDKDNRIARTNGNETKIYDHTYGRGLNVYGDYIYYLPIEDKSGIYRVDKENADQIEQVVTGAHIGDLIVINDSLYYARFGETESGLYRSSLDGQKEKQLLKATINGFQFYDGWFYAAITDGGSILKISLNGKELSELETEDGVQISATKFIISEDWIYFENSSDDFDLRYKGEPSKGQKNIYRMKLDGSKLEYLSQVYNGLLVFVDEGSNIYYMSKDNPNDENQLIQKNINTGDKKVLYKGEHFFNWGNKIGEDLYFMAWGNNPNETTRIYKTKLNEDQLEVFDVPTP